jgi:hypothetical protein
VRDVERFHDIKHRDFIGPSSQDISARGTPYRLQYIMPDKRPKNVQQKALR